MIFIEQDKEQTRENLLKFYAFVTEQEYEVVKKEYLGIIPDGTPKHTVLVNRLYPAVEAFVAQNTNLITADRKRVALEAGIDELEKTIKNAPIADYEGCDGVVYNAKHPNHKYMLKRIAELKAQQEEV